MFSSVIESMSGGILPPEEIQIRSARHGSRRFDNRLKVCSTETTDRNIYTGFSLLGIAT
jgi:hypothetical protein